MLPINGYLRDSVLVNSSPSGVELRFSVWSIALPIGLLESSPKLSAFFRREASSSELGSECEQVRNLIYVLFHQGCLIPANVKSIYQLPEVKPLYISFCNESYGRYYAHNLWTDMRSADILISIIRQWISRTYFLSRFAGVTASAASRNGPTQEIRSVFLKSAIEEYSHCEDYYRPPEALFPAGLGYTCGISAAASFLAFDHQMLRIAQQDWLAHLFVALFQERTAQFRDGAHKLYSRVEGQLGTPGLFNGWRTHISFDEKNSHEGDLDELFDQKLNISLDQLQLSFEEAALAIDLLIDGLDEVRRFGKAGMNPRAVASANVLQVCHLEGIQCLSGIFEHPIKAISIDALATEFAELVASTSKGSIFLTSSSVFLVTQIAHCLVSLTAECIENCETHDEIICLGNILDAGLKAGFKPEAEASALKKSNRVVRNFFHRKSKNPAGFAFSLLLLIRLTEAGLKLSDHPNEIGAMRLIAQSLETAVQQLGKSDLLVEYANEALSGISLLEYAYEKSDSAPNSRKFAVGLNTVPQEMPAGGHH